MGRFFRSRWRQGMPKAHRFTLQMPACVTVDAIGRVDPSVLKRYGELVRTDNIAGFGIGPVSANWSHSIRLSGNRVTASVRVTLRTVSPL